MTRTRAVTSRADATTASTCRSSSSRPYITCTMLRAPRPSGHRAAVWWLTATRPSETRTAMRQTGGRVQSGSGHPGRDSVSGQSEVDGLGERPGVIVTGELPHHRPTQTVQPDVDRLFQDDGRIVVRPERRTVEQPREAVDQVVTCGESLTGQRLQDLVVLIAG